MPETKTSTKYEKARTTDKVWTDEERAAMQESARERKDGIWAPRPGRRAGRGRARTAGEDRQDAGADRAMAERIHNIVTNAPSLIPKTYYGMPAYHRRQDGKTIAFSRPSRSSGSAIQPSASSPMRTSTTARCGQPSSRSFR